ncbi:MAG: PAS domain-containing sensor histidine kinase [Alphaproteobacteria bacterium]|nr:PAS domain-containing sensor histidine kinase [Alphaproteobacteria bacterium]
MIRPCMGTAGFSVALQAAIADRLTALVHHGVGEQGGERARHLHFIAIHLALAAVAAIALPVYLTVNGRPGLADTLAFVCALTPVAAVFYASRTGRLMHAQILSIAALIGMGVTLSLGSPGVSASTALWLALAPVAALLAYSLPLIVIAGVAALGGVSLIAIGKANGMLLAASPVSQTVSAMTAAMAIIFACAVMYSAISLYEMNRKREAFEAARYRTLFDAMGDLVLFADRSGAILTSSKGARAMPGDFARLRMSDLAGRGLFERIHVADRPLYLKSCADALERASTVIAVMRVRMDGADPLAPPQFAWVEARIRKLDTVPLTQGRLAQDLIMVLRDVSEEKNHAAELEAAREQAELANKWKDRFLANISHELRTPLNAIIGFSEFLGDSAIAPSDPAKRAEYANIIRESGEHLLSVVNTILDKSKIEAGSFEIFPEAFDLPVLLDQCCNMISLKAVENGVDLRRLYAPAFDEVVADKRAIKQVIINLLSNAVKFTPQGGSVSLEVRRDGAHVNISVTDTGIGIQAGDLARIGDPFFQARNSYDRAYEGTGLGLSVVRGLIGLHGGSIKMESAQGEGTCVSIRLPMECQQEKIAGRTSAKIETIPRVNRAGTRAVENLPAMVKQIA